MQAQTALTRYTKPASINTEYAHRRFGKPTSAPPLVFHNHFRGNMDWWDPLLLNTICATRECVLFDSPGVGKTAGQVKKTSQDWADDMIAFLQCLGLEKVDLFGFSMGARVTQIVAIAASQLVRKMVLAGASPAYRTPHSPADDPKFDPKYSVGMITAETYEEGRDGFRIALFGPTEAGRKLFEQYWSRLHERRQVEEPLLMPLARDTGGDVQTRAVKADMKPAKVRWPDPLAELTIPVLIANGNNDLTLPTARSWEIMQRIEKSQLVIYPRSGHGFIWQYAEVFGEQVNTFLDTDAFEIYDKL